MEREKCQRPESAAASGDHDQPVDTVKDFFKIPEPLIKKEFSRIMSLKDGLKKMSKSEISDLSRINPTDDKDTIANKIKKAVFILHCSS